jgi:hypothetical protein
VPADGVPPAVFRIYGDGGTGEVDFETPVDSVDADGAGDHEWTSGALTGGVRYRFVVRAQSVDGGEEVNADAVAAAADAQAPAAPAALWIEGT